MDMDTISGVVVVGLLGAFFVFGLVGYLRGKSIRSCCDLPTTSHPKETAK
jgi:hypothetical protein